jgi:hypothetical protein
MVGLDVLIAGYIVSAGSATFLDIVQPVVVSIDRLSEIFRNEPMRPTDPT